MFTFYNSKLWKSKSWADSYKIIKQMDFKLTQSYTAAAFARSTPIQTASAYIALSNGLNFYKPKNYRNLEDPFEPSCEN